MFCPYCYFNCRHSKGGEKTNNKKYVAHVSAYFFFVEGNVPLIYLRFVGYLIVSLLSYLFVCLVGCVSVAFGIYSGEHSTSCTRYSGSSIRVRARALDAIAKTGVSQTVTPTACEVSRSSP